MKIKLFLLSFLLSTLSACASVNTKSNESLRLMDGSMLMIENGRVMTMTDKTGAPVNIKKGWMMELANGSFVYIRQDGTVNKIARNNTSDGHNSKGSGHSH